MHRRSRWPAATIRAVACVAQLRLQAPTECPGGQFTQGISYGTQRNQASLGIPGIGCPAPELWLKVLQG